MREVLKLRLSKNGNPVIDKKMMEVDIIYAHKSIPNLLLYEKGNCKIVKPHNGILIKFEDYPTLYRVVRQHRFFEGELDVVKKNKEVVYWLELRPSSTNEGWIKKSGDFHVY